MDQRPRFSPDGSQIAFVRARRSRRFHGVGELVWDDWDVYVMNADGTRERRLTTGRYYGIDRTVFSADGERILYSAHTPRARSQFTVTVREIRLDGSEASVWLPRKRLAAGECYAWASEPSPSTSGENVVFVSDRGDSFHYDLLLKERQSGTIKPLGATRITQYNCCPSFTADGRRILFLASTSWDKHSRPILSLWSINIDGENSRQIADNRLFSSPLVWRSEDQELSSVPTPRWSGRS